MISAEMVGSSASYSYGSAGRVAGARFLVDLMNEFSPAALAVDEKPRVVRISWRNIMGGAGESPDLDQFGFIHPQAQRPKNSQRPQTENYT